jgi:rRNA maturation protein Nop10
MKLRKTVDGRYTLKEVDERGRKTEEAHYKYIRIKDVKEREKDNQHIMKD